MRTFSLFLPLVAVAPLSCTGGAGSASRDALGDAPAPIVGEDARADVTHGAVVAVRTVGGSLCSGTILRKGANGRVDVLTAAHCCRPNNPPRKVAIGADYGTPAATLAIASFTAHPCYNPLSNDYDFCVLSATDPDGLDVRPIPLASAPDALAAGSPVTVVGYGSTPATNTIRRWARARLLEDSPLSLAIDQTGDKGGICFGDSGGPVLIAQDGHEVVAGVVSFGAPTSLCNVVGAAERVSFRGVRQEFLDKVLAGEKPTLEMLLIRREGITPGAVRDTTLASEAPDEPFGGTIDLLVGTAPGGDTGQRALVRFDLSGLPAGATVLTARTGFHIESRTGAGLISVHRVTREWDEQRETWSSFGERGFDRAPLAALGNATAVVRSTEQLWFDLTGLVTEWASGQTANHGILLRGTGGQQSQLMSSEIGRLSERPWMSICYVPARR